MHLIGCFSPLHFFLSSICSRVIDKNLIPIENRILDKTFGIFLHPLECKEKAWEWMLWNGCCVHRNTTGFLIYILEVSWGYLIYILTLRRCFPDLAQTLISCSLKSQHLAHTRFLSLTRAFLFFFIFFASVFLPVVSRPSYHSCHFW